MFKKLKHLALWVLRKLAGIYPFKYFLILYEQSSIHCRSDSGYTEETGKQQLPKRSAGKFFQRTGGKGVRIPALPCPDSFVQSAEQVCRHQFDLLGSGLKDLGTPIDWHCDFKTGYRWDPKAFYRDIKIPYGIADIKVPWELSRFYHAVVLGQAYRLTENHKYAQEFITQVEDWIDHNPPLYGVNWSCTMEVAIRCCNWILGYTLMKDSPGMTDSFLIKFFKSIHQHGRYIISHLEYSKDLTSNHYLSNLTGLLYIGTCFPELREAEAWRTFAIKGLKQEIAKQVYDDGCDFEASTCYHRLVLELFFFPVFLAVINHPEFTGENYRETADRIFDEAFTNRLYKMFEAVLYLLKPTGCMPQIGDNDNGRLHILGQRETLDMRYLLTIGAIFFNEPRFKINEYGLCPEAYWLFGEKGTTRWAALKGLQIKDIGSHNFHNSGWYVARHNQDYLLISCGPNGQNGNGGHAHNDKLSFELCLAGRDIIIDPGTYVYTANPEWRNRFRSSDFHNNVSIDSLEQNRIDSGNIKLFTLANDAAIRADIPKATDDGIIFEGEHTGYLGRCGVIHKRKIKFVKNEFFNIEFIDIFLGEGEHSLQWNLVLHPEAGDSVQIVSPDLAWEQTVGYYSRGYGEKAETRKMTARKRITLPCEIRFSIVPAGHPVN